jgi:hypothetical protein
MSTCRSLKLDLYFSPYAKIHSKWIKDLNLRPKTLKELEEHIGKTLEERGFGNAFLKIIPIVQQ